MAGNGREKLHSFMTLVDKLVKEGVMDDEIVYAACEGEEWNTKHWMHSSDILKAFMCGVVDSQSWERSNNCLPVGFDVVCNRVKNSIKRTFMTDTVNLSFAEVYSYLSKWVPCRESKEWPSDESDETGESGLYLNNVLTNSMMALRETVLKLEEEIKQTEASNDVKRCSNVSRKDATHPIQNRGVEDTSNGNTEGLLRQLQ